MLNVRTLIICMQYSSMNREKEKPRARTKRMLKSTKERSRVNRLERKTSCVNKTHAKSKYISFKESYEGLLF